MKKKNLINLLLLVCTIALFSYDLPKGWFKAGSNPDQYDMGTDVGSGMNGKNAATIKSIRKKAEGFGTLMQNSSPGKYLGKRVRMSGYMKSDDVTGWAGLWFRVDKDKSSNYLSFDNMGNRPVRGATDWKKYEIVLDVPGNATNLAYGALLAGRGQIWFDNITFEIVDTTVPTTGHFKEPQNLNFEE